MAKTSININTLRNAINAVLDFISDNAGEAVEIEVDFYNSFELSEMFSNIGEENTSYGIGSIEDDWKFVESSDRSVFVPLMLTHIAPILQALAKSIPNFPSVSQAGN